MHLCTYSNYSYGYMPSYHNVNPFPFTYSFCADTDRPDKGHLAFVYFAKAPSLLGCVLQSISSFSGLRFLRARNAVCLPVWLPRGTVHVALCQGKQSPPLFVHHSLTQPIRKRKGGKKPQKTVSRLTARLSKHIRQHESLCFIVLL